MMPAHIKDAAVGVGVALVGVAQAYAGAVTDAPEIPSSTEDLLLRLVREGGAWAIVGVLLFFYRRDWQRLADTATPLVAIAQRSSEALAANAVAMQQQAAGLDRLIAIVGRLENEAERANDREAERDARRRP
jgi:hypothetical protein